VENVIQTYYIHHIVIVMWPTSISCVASLPFIYPLRWPHGIVKFPADMHFRISPEVSHLGTSHLQFDKYCEFRQSSHHIFIYYTVVKYAISDEAIQLTYLAPKCFFFLSWALNLNTHCLNNWLLYCKCHKAEHKQQLNH